MSATRHIIPISGKDSLATAIVQTARRPDLDYEYIYNDTHAELPDTYAWLDKVEQTMGFKITRIGKSLEEIIYEQGILPSARMRYCTKYAKIFPMLDFIGKKDEATIYIGIRADESRMGQREEKNTKVCYPLKEMGVNLALVYRIVGDKGLLPPTFFWKRMHDSVVAKLGDAAFIINELPKWVFDRTFAWRSRPNCYFCFYQRQYEWVGLLEHYPALFDRAEKIELQPGASNTRENPYFWISKTLSLSKIRERAEEIFQKRANALCKLIWDRLNRELFDEALVDALDAAGTSCGLYCGK